MKIFFYCNSCNVINTRSLRRQVTQKISNFILFFLMCNDGQFDLLEKKALTFFLNKKHSNQFEKSYLNMEEIISIKI